MSLKERKPALICPQCGGGLVQIAETPYSYDPDPYADEDWMARYFRCESCRELSEMWDNGKAQCEIRPYNGLLGEEEVKAHAHEGSGALRVLEKKKIIEIHDKLEKEGRLTPEIERAMLFDLGVHGEKALRNLERSVTRAHPGIRPAYPSVWAYIVNEVVPMDIRCFERKMDSDRRLNKILFGPGAINRSRQRS